MKAKFRHLVIKVNQKDLHKRRIANERGSFTIEASLIFPIIFLVTIALIFLSVVIYQKATLHFIAEETAERAAFSWNNSFKKAETGAFKIGQWDGLYWRITDDDLVNGLLGTINKADKENKEIVHVIGSHVSSGERSLVQKKLSNFSPSGVTGTIRFEHGFLKRKVIVTLYSPLHLPAFIKVFFGTNMIRATSSFSISEPVEFIRNVDFLRTYTQKIRGKMTGEDFKNIIKQRQVE